MRLGFIGTGTIAAAIVEGLSKARVSSLEIVVSPRNATIAQVLEARFANVRAAKSNQAVLDATDLVVLAVRPQVAEEVLRGLRFRRGHQVVSLVAAWPIDRVRSMVAPATTVARAAPLPFVANLIGPTALYDAPKAVVELFDHLGSAMPVESEEAFDALMATTSIMGSYFELLHTVSTWLAGAGLSEGLGAQFASQIFYALGSTARCAPSSDFAALREEFSTKGGLNEQLAERLAAAGVFSAVHSGLDGVMERLRGSSTTFRSKHVTAP